MEILIPFASQRVSGSLDVEGPLGDRFGLSARKCRGLCFQDRFGRGSGYGFYLPMWRSNSLTHM